MPFGKLHQFEISDWSSALLMTYWFIISKGFLLFILKPLLVCSLVTQAVTARIGRVVWL